MTEIQLSKAQTEILIAACARQDGTVLSTEGSVKGGALRKVCQSLLKRELVEEIPARDKTTAWRQDEKQGPMTLRATPQAYTVLDHTDDANGAAPSGNATAPDRKSTKQAMLIEMLRAEHGATIAEITSATGWKAHTSRGVISGTLKKKLGLDVTSEKVEGRGRVYKLAAA